MKPRLVILLWTATLLTACASPSAPDRSATPSYAPGTAIPSAVPEAAFVPGPAGLSIEIYTLSGQPQLEPLTFSPLLGTQAEIEARHQDIRDQNLPRRVAAANLALYPFKYRLEAHYGTQANESTTYQVFKSGDALFTKQVFDFSQIWVNSDRSDFWMLVEAADGMYMLRRNSVTKWTGSFALGVLGNDLVYVDEKSANPNNPNMVVKRGDQILLDTPGMFPLPVPLFGNLWSDGQHWAVEIYHPHPNTVFEGDGEVFIDGQSQNQAHGYQQTFSFASLGGQPFYFYQQGDKIGIDYAGQTVPLGFDEIEHYLCCSAGALNPVRYDRMVDFFARRGGTWYFVEALARGN